MDNNIMNRHFSLFCSTLKAQVKQIKSWLVLFSGLLLSSATIAIDIANEPLFLSNQAPANIMFILDDSGSMDWDVLTVPHWRTQNYDHDYRRYWARGGWLSNHDLPMEMVTDSSWYSYSGACEDRNTDGICFNKLLLNDNESNRDGETPELVTQEADNDFGVRLIHLYVLEKPEGKCIAKDTDASAADWLPNLDKVFSFITGSKSAHAHSGVYGPSAAPFKWTGVNDPSEQNTGSGAYREELWGRAYTYNTWEVDNKYYKNVEQKEECEKKGWKWVSGGSGEASDVRHHSEDTFSGASNALGGSGWVSATKVNRLTGAIESVGNVGDYHKEVIINYTTRKVKQARFDINGDGKGTQNSRYNESDYDLSAKKSMKYYYLTDKGDNTYTNGSYAPCHVSNPPYVAAAAERCDPLNARMLQNYKHSSTPAGIDNPSKKVADSTGQFGLTDFVKIPKPPVKPRFIRSNDWVGAPRSGANDVLLPAWAANTKHAMSQHDPFPLAIDWRPRSADFNVLYYSPESAYNPWPSPEAPPSSSREPDMHLYDADFNKVRSNPQPNSAGYKNFSNLARPSTEYSSKATGGAKKVEAGFVYEVWLDDAGHFGNMPSWSTGGDARCGSTGGFTLADSDFPADATDKSITDPITGTKHRAGAHLCFNYMNKKNGDGIVDLWDSHYRVEVKNNEIIVQKVRRTPHLKGKPIFSSRGPGAYPPVYTKGSDLYPANNVSEYGDMRVAMSETKVLEDAVTYKSNKYASYSSSALCLQVLGEDPENEGHCRTVKQVKQNVANWYQYSRKRSFVAKGAIARLMEDMPDLNYGLMGTSKNTNNIKADLTSDISKLFKDIFDGKGSGNGDEKRDAHNESIQSALYSHAWRPSDTPLRQALQRAGEYFAGRGPNLTEKTESSPNNHHYSPITASCQKSYALMLTDGYWSGEAPANIADIDGDKLPATLADVAKKYYDEDLSSLSLGAYEKQTLTTFGVGFGIKGSLEDTDDDGWPNGTEPYVEASIWGGNPDTESDAEQKYKIDDLWHAAYNSGGRYYEANNPQELIARLTQALLSVESVKGSASGLAVNEEVLTTDTRVYQTLFDSDGWSGDLISRSISTDSDDVRTFKKQWSAMEELDKSSVTYDNRTIFTWNDASSAGAAFRWDSISTQQQNKLKIQWLEVSAVEENADEFGEAQLNFIRGKNDDAQFRIRSHILGDIIHSAPLYLGVPDAGYKDSIEESAKYSDFKKISRAPLVFAGANDGMLHAFDASTGVEAYAYVPAAVIPNLNALTHKTTAANNFFHQYYVDETPVVKDVFFDSRWHSVLVGGLGAGGKSMYALDVTSVPTDESSAKKTVLWEFTDEDMNYSYGQAAIRKMENGKWAAIFGNGYNKNSDGKGKAVLYIVNIENGDLIKKITLPSKASVDNGLSSPTAIDRDGDFIVDNIYAGDLQGNVWRFDVSDAKPDNWKISFGRSRHGKPLFKAKAKSQSITTRISVTRHPQGASAGVMLHFGTGRYIGAADITEKPFKTQSMYGLWDYYGIKGAEASGSHSRSDLLQQKILAELPFKVTKKGADGVDVVTTTAVRVTTDFGERASVTRDIQWLADGSLFSDRDWPSHVSDKGWYMDLVNTQAGNTNNKGERIITNVLVSEGAVHFSTMLPAEDACTGGGSAWPMVLNAENGARFSSSVLDVNGDGVFDSKDYVTYTLPDGTKGEIPVSGVKHDGIFTDPLLLDIGGGKSLKLTDTSTTEITEEEVLINIAGSRASWIQLD
ncbi:MAG: hypothetical protein GQ475_04880 [Methylococcaceae bacterium]|nr:hypothetical protein [Methylococcaceae bacterium]